MRRVRIPVSVFMVMFALMLIGMMGCVPQTGEPIKLEQMSPKQYALWMNNIYLNEHAAYERDITVHNQDVLAKPDGQLTAEELAIRNDKRDIFKRKKQVLTELHSALVLYNSYMTTGIVPTNEITIKATELIDKLLSF